MCHPASTCLVLFAFSFVVGDYYTNIVPCFYHILRVFIVHFTVLCFYWSLHKLKRFIPTNASYSEGSGVECCYPTPDIKSAVRGLTSSLQEISWMVAHNITRPLPSISFLIHHSRFISQFKISSLKITNQSSIWHHCYRMTWNVHMCLLCT
jgi:hypothetical protein